MSRINGKRNSLFCLNLGPVINGNTTSALDEVRALLKLSETDGTNACHEVRKISAAHLGDVRRRVADLRAMERALGNAIRQCDAGQQPGLPAHCDLVPAPRGRSCRHGGSA